MLNEYNIRCFLDCILSVNLCSTTHSATPARGTPSARDSERIRLSLSSEGMQRGPFLRQRVSHGSRFHREGPIKVKAQDLVMVVLAHRTKNSSRSI